jgi:hypothetical protein
MKPHDDSSNGYSPYVATIDAAGDAPQHRIGDPEQAQRVWMRCFQGYIYNRGRINAKVQAAINGEVPVAQAALDEAGLGWMSNVNFRMLEADVNAGQIPYYMLFADVPQYAQVTVRIPKLTAQQNKSIGDIIGAEHKVLCDQWKQFDYHMQLSIANMVKYGSGPLYFPDKDDFRYRAAQQGTVYVPDETTQDLTELALCFVYYEWEVTDLFREISHPKAEEAGWNVQNIKEVLMNACNEFSGFTRNKSWEYWEQKLREEDVYWSNVVPKVRTTWGYVREFDGKITRFLITANWNIGSTDWLYYGDREFDSWQQIIHPFFSEIGNGNWNGVKGLGIKAYNWRDGQNRLWNRIMDAAFLGTQVVWQAQDAKSAEDFQMVQMGPNAIIPAGVNVVQSPLVSTLDKPMNVAEAMERGLQRNVGGIRQNQMDQSSQPPTATQSNIDATYNSQLTQAGQTLYLRQLDDIYEEQFRRLSKKTRTPTKNYPLTETEALKKAFRDRCRERGVPDEAFGHIVTVKATRSIGRGSEYFKQQLGQQVYNILRSDPNVPQGVVTAHLRNLISNFTGREYLDMVWPDDQSAVSPTQDESKATDENSTMMSGIPPLWTPEQDNLAHATTHLQFLGQQAQGVQQGQVDPAVYLKTAQAGIPHVQQHLKALQGQGNNGQPYQQLYNGMEQIQSQTNQIGQQYQQHQQAMQAQQQDAQQKMQQAQQAGQLLDPESKVKLARVQADARIKGIATAADIRRKDALARAEIVHKTAGAAQSMILDTVKAAKPAGKAPTNGR